MGFLWFGKTINTWKDIGDEKDLKEQREKLNAVWKLLLARKEKAQSQFGEYLKEAEKDSTSDSAKEKAAYDMSLITKSIRRYDEELNLTQVNLLTLDAVLDLKKECEISTTLGVSLGKMDPDELQATLIAAAQARKDITKEEIIIACGTSHPSTLSVEVEQDDDMKAARALIDGD